ncbi:MAG: GNAT family N-acetyltransferase [Planctomycetota bacterium]
MKIVRLTETDAERFRALRLASLREAPDAFGSTANEVAARPPEVWIDQLRTLPTFVAVDEGRDVGLVRGAPHDTLPGVAYLISMWVAPEARGRGAGDALIKAVIDWAQGVGYVRLVLDVGDDNPAAIALYERNGFHPNGERSVLDPPRQHITEHQRELRFR